MRARTAAALGASALLGAATVGASATARAPEDRHRGARAVAVLHDAQGDRVGRVVMRRHGDAVRVTARVTGLPPGFHGFHVHAMGACDAPTFTSAGPHWSRTAAPHAEHTGDLPVLYVQADGEGRLSVDTDRFRVAQLFDADGSAVIVHANANNFANIPPRYGGPDAETLAAGDSGARLACGEVERR